MDKLPLVLLVEDEPLIRTVLAEALEASGYSLVEAEDGGAAMEVIDSSETLAGIVTDIRLGEGADGWEVARHARHNFASVAVVYMTGDSASDWTSEGVPNSIMLQKPFATAQVVTAVSMLLNAANGPASEDSGSGEHG